MAIRKIAQMGHPILRQRAEEVPPVEIRSPFVQTLIDDMIETMRDADGAGIAAPQVHESKRICVIEVAENPRYPDFPRIPLMVLVNPVVTPMVDSPREQLAKQDVIALYEGCLSVTGIRGRVERPRKVHVTAFDRDGAPFELTWEGIPAAIVQHETDHLDGVLFVDRADTRSLTFLRELERHGPRSQPTTSGDDD